MEFFRSKYYKPTNTLPQTNLHDSLHERIISDVLHLKIEGFSFTASSILKTYLQALPSIPDVKLDIDTITSSENWELVTDLQITNSGLTPESYLENGLDALSSKVYYHAGTEAFVHVRYIDWTSTNNVYIPYGIDPVEVLLALKADGSMIDKTHSPLSRIYILTARRGGLHLESTSIADLPIDFNTMYDDNFKPVVERMVTELNDTSSTGLMLLHGEPGTGKTNYLRWLSNHKVNRKLVFIPPNMVAKLTVPNFIEFLLSNKGLTFIVEDAESVLRPRMGSEVSVVSTILNITDGLLGDILKCQFICTFNTTLSEIDDALLRPGRLLTRHEFNKLSVEKSNAYLASIGSNRKVDTPTSLAELTNLETAPTVALDTSSKSSFGFLQH